MIDALDETIRKLVLTRARFAEDSVAVTFDQPTGQWAAGLTRPTVNFYLYDLRENLELRSAEWLLERQGSAPATKRLAPRRYDLSYLVTVWTQQQVEDEHAILWRVLAALATHPALPEDILEGPLRQQTYPILTRTAQPSIALQNLPDLWSVMENPLRPSLDYVVTLAMERDVQFTSPLVLTKRLSLAAMGEPATRETLTQIAGIVHTADGTALAGAMVMLVETGHTALADRFGRYTFGRVEPGKYRLRVAIAQDVEEGRKQRPPRVVERNVTVPPAAPDQLYFDLEV